MAKFLLVDDAKFMQTLAEKLLLKMGHEIPHKASNGLEALDYYGEHWSSIDVVLLDVVMPKFDGFYALEKLQKTATKIIVTTGLVEENSLNELNQFSVFSIQRQPVDFSKILKILNI